MPDIFDAAPTQSNGQPPAGQPSGDIFDAAGQPQTTTAPTTPAQPQMGPQGLPATTFQAAPNENTPEGAAAALAQRQAQYPTLTAIGQGAGDVLGDVWDAVKSAPAGIANSLPPVTLYHSIESAMPILKAYEDARSSGKGIVDSLSAANEVAKQHDGAQQALQQRIADFKKQPGRATVRALGDAAATAATIWDGGELNPANLEGPATAAPEAAETVTAPKPGIVSKAVSGVKGLVSDIPADVESKLVSTIGDAAEDAGLERPTATTLKESVADFGDQLKQRAQSVYQDLDSEAPGFQELRDKTMQLQKAYKTQLNIDPAKADEIEGELKTAQQNMNELLDKGQTARWKAADADWSRYKALQKVGTKTAGAAEDLTDPSLTNVDKLHTAVKGLTNSTRGANPIDLLSKAFPDHAEDIRSIVQKGANISSNAQAAKQFIKWVGIPIGATALGAKGVSVLKTALGGH